MKKIESMLFGHNAVGSYFEVHLIDGSHYKISHSEDNPSVLILSAMYDLITRKGE